MGCAGGRETGGRQVAPAGAPGQECSAKLETPSTCAYIAYIAQWIGVLAILALIISDYLLQIPSGLLGGIVLYLGGVVHALKFSKAAGYLKHVMSEKDFAQSISAMQASPPKVTFSIACYHMEARQQTSTDSNGNSHTTTTYVKVVTHRASMPYAVKGFVDETLSVAQMLAMLHLTQNGTKDLTNVEEGALEKVKGKRAFLLCNFPIEFLPATPADEIHRDSAKEAFFAANISDSAQDKEEAHTVDDHIDRCLVVLSGCGSDETHRPWWMYFQWYVVSAFCMASIPYRLYFFKQCQLVEWTVLKHFSAERPREQWGDPVPMKSRLKRQDAVSAAFRALPRQAF